MCAASNTWRDWTIRELIGAGSFGKVYRIERNIGGFVENSALKVITVPRDRAQYDAIRSEGMSHSETATYFKGVVDDLSREFALMSQLKGNSNIVSFEDYEVVQNPSGFGWTIFIRMELLTSLTEWIKTNKITYREVVRLGSDICRALELCESKGIMHRDIKPDNIFYSDQGTFKLGDFGIAKRLEHTTAATARRGTITYMAPEVYAGQMYNHTADLYSLGIVLYRLLNNNRAPLLPPYPEPIRFEDRERSSIRRLKGEALPLPCNAVNALGQAVLRACAFRPEDRYQSAYEMRNALSAAANAVETAERAAAQEIPDPVNYEPAPGGTGVSGSAYGGTTGGTIPGTYGGTPGGPAGSAYGRAPGGSAGGRPAKKGGIAKILIPVLIFFVASFIGRSIVGGGSSSSGSQPQPAGTEQSSGSGSSSGSDSGTTIDKDTITLHKVYLVDDGDTYDEYQVIYYGAGTRTIKCLEDQVRYDAGAGYTMEFFDEKQDELIESVYPGYSTLSFVSHEFIENSDGSITGRIFFKHLNDPANIKKLAEKKILTFNGEPRVITVDEFSKLMEDQGHVEIGIAEYASRGLIVDAPDD